MPFTDTHFETLSSVLVADIFSDARWIQLLGVRIYWVMICVIQWLNPLYVMWRLLWRLVIAGLRQLYRFRHRRHSKAIQLPDFTLRHFVFRKSLSLARRINSPVITRLWWSCYFIMSDLQAAEQDFLEAYARKLSVTNERHYVHVYIRTSHLRVPIGPWTDDALTLELLRMFYGLMKYKKGLQEIILPRILVRLDSVNVCSLSINDS
jgi:hypothetical protein